MQTLLLIAENTDSLDQVRSALPEYDLLHCADPHQAVELCRRHGIRLALVVEEGNSGSGCALFDRLRKQCPEVSGLLLAPGEDYTILRRAIGAGLSGLVEIPDRCGRLRGEVARIIDAMAMQEENSRLRALLPLYSLGEQFLTAADEQEILDHLLDVIVDQTGGDQVSVMLFDEREECLRIAASRGMDGELARSIRLRPGDQIAGWVFQQGRPVILNRDARDQSPFAALMTRSEIASAISFPLIIRGRIIGVVNISRQEGEVVFSEADKEMLGIICGQAALALENIRFLEATRETTRMRTLLEQYVAPEVAELLLDNDQDIMGLGEIREVTVFFADIRNFTRLVQHLELENLRRFLNEFFQIFTDAIFQHRGTVDKFMGDAVLAVFGAPVTLDNANLAAVRTALLIRERFGRLRRHWASHWQDFQNVDLGIGVTRGRIFLGNVGSDRRLDYTVIGTPVNIAQRLAAESSRCRIYITEPVRQGLAGKIETEPLGELELRGLERGVMTYRVTGE